MATTQVEVSQSDSSLDIRRAPQQPNPTEQKEFANNSAISILQSSSNTPVGQQGLWKRCDKLSVKTIAYRNLLGVAVSFFICFSTFIAEVSLQSSVNADKGLGVLSLSISEVCLMLSGILVGPSVLIILGTKWSLLFAYVIILAYILANFYPTWFTLIPVTVFLGIGSGWMYAAVLVHAIAVAHRTAPSLKKNPDHMAAVFVGVVNFFVKIGYIPGNIVSSTVLLSGRNGTGSNYSTDVCNSTEEANLDVIYLYILNSVFVAFDIVAIILLLVFVDSVRSPVSFTTGKEFCCDACKRFLQMVKILFSWKMQFHTPMIVLDGMMIAFILGGFMKVYISDCIGVSFVGIASMIFGTASASTAFLSGRLVKYVPQWILVYVNTFLNAVALLFLAFWEPTPSYYILFGCVAVFGLIEGCWYSTTPIITGQLFPDQRETAMAINRSFWSVGFLCGWIAPLLFSTHTSLWIMCALLALTLLTYTGLTVCLRYEVKERFAAQK